MGRFFRRCFFTLLDPVAFRWSWSRYNALPALGNLVARDEPGHESRTQPCVQNPTISIVVPARNEMGRLPPLLASLRALNDEGLEILVVDDASEDGTAALVESAGLRVLRLDGPPAGWTGKNWACWKGVQATAGEWILFVDADVGLRRFTPIRMVKAARKRGDVLFSIFLQQRCESFWEKLLLPYLYCLYFLGGGGPLVNSSPPAALANGQCLLVSRGAYLATGGHQAIRSSVVDDVALAAHFISRGRRVGVARGEEAGAVRMYTGLTSIREGFSKSMLRFVVAGRSAGMRTALGSMLSLSLVVGAVASRRPRRVLALAIPAGGLIPWYRRFGVSPIYACLFPLAAVVTQIIIVEAMVRAAFGRTTWRGRVLA